MRYLSVCSGIEAATCAWHTLGWKPVGFSEIEPFPSAVLAHRFPDVKNYGDMTKYKEWNDVGQFDVLVGGTPCQSFSVAGLRRGLTDPRGNLMLTFGAIADNFKPTWLLWENVPGVLSSNGGRDFGVFLGMLGELGYGFAYRILDAQYFGVPQRRRRVFVVGYLGDWRPAAAVLFESHSLQGHPAPSREKREGAARGVEIGPSGGCFTDVNPTLDTKCKDGPIRNQLAGAVMCFEASRRDGIRLHGESSPTLQSFMGTGGNNQPMVMSTGQGNAEITQNHAPTLNCNHEAPILSYVSEVVAFASKQQSMNVGHDVANPLLANDYKEPQVVAFAQNTRDEVRLFVADGQIVGALAAEPGMKQTSYVKDQNSVVRRLTPREYERLQGFPDDWTLIPWRGKSAEDCPDGPRYKACGNSMAVNVMRWIGERIRGLTTAST